MVRFSSDDDDRVILESLKKEFEKEYSHRKQESIEDTIFMDKSKGLNYSTEQEVLVKYKIDLFKF